MGGILCCRLPAVNYVEKALGVVVGTAFRVEAEKKTKERIEKENEDLSIELFVCGFEAHSELIVVQFSSVQ